MRSQSGIALVLVLFVLLAVSLLGVLSLAVSRSDLKTSSSYAASQSALNAADRAVEYVRSSPALLGTTDDTDLSVSEHADAINIAGSRLLAGATNRVRNQGPGDLPSAVGGRFGADFGGNYYLIEVTGADGTSRSQVHVESQQVRVFQREDDAKLYTDDGG